MIFSWIGHPSFTRDEQLLAVLHYLGVATKRQIAVISGWTENEIEWSLKRIRKWEKDKEKRKEWIRTYRIPNDPTRKAAYALGKLGVKYVYDMSHQQLKRKEAPKGQVAHYLGLNNVLVRLLESGADRENLIWLSTTEAIDFLTYLHETWDLEIDRKTLIRPDARMVLDGKAYWIEYDKATEGPRQLERKFHQYVETLIHPQKKWIDPWQAPVIWVTTTKQRRDYLEKIWMGTRKRFAQYPEMHFFVEGEETRPLLLKLDSKRALYALK